MAGSAQVKRRVARVVEALQEERLDGLLLTTPANITYLSGFRGEDSALLVTARGRFLVTDGRYTEEAERECPEAQVVEHRRGLMRAVAAALEHILSGRPTEAGEVLDRLLTSARFGMRLLQPPRVAILGRPNVGKSTLLNALLGRERALVHPAPGTTRDYLDELAEVAGLPLILMDTAGIRPTEEAVERAGIELALEQARRADLVLLLFDGSEPLRPEDCSLFRHLPPCELLAVVNKADLPPPTGGG